MADVRQVYSPQFEREEGRVRRQRDSAKGESYELEFSVHVWRELADIAPETRVRCLDMLRALAENTAPPSAEAKGRSEPLEFQRDGYHFICELSHPRRTMTLMQVVPIERFSELRSLPELHEALLAFECGDMPEVIGEKELWMRKPSGATCYLGKYLGREPAPELVKFILNALHRRLNR
jgi:hypothetical protein